MTRALVTTTPFAARAQAGAVTAIRDILRQGGWSVDVEATAGHGDARRIAEQARGAGFDVLVSHGGDGTAMQVAAGIAGTGIALGLVPGGTGNVLAGEVRVARPPTSAGRAPRAPPPPPHRSRGGRRAGRARPLSPAPGPGVAPPVLPG